MYPGQGGRGGSPQNCPWGCGRFLNGDAIPDENMPFFVRLYALVVLLKTLPDFRLQWSKSYRLRVRVS